jgi:hypothetical protein
VSDFFEFPEPEPEPPRPPKSAQPPWQGAPRGMVAGAVPVEFVLASNDRAAVAITKIGAYPVGFEFELVVLASDEAEQDLDPMIGGFMRHPGMRRGDPKRDMLRFGIEFADGAKATNVGGRHRHLVGDEPPPAPVMHTGGGSSGGGHWQQDLWVWPLPPAGPLRFVCEWPAAGIELTSVEVDAQLVIEAAGRAQQIFERTGEAGWSSHSGPVQFVRKADD